MNKSSQEPKSKTSSTSGLTPWLPEPTREKTMNTQLVCLPTKATSTSDPFAKLKVIRGILENTPAEDFHTICQVLWENGA